MNKLSGAIAGATIVLFLSLGAVYATHCGDGDEHDGPCQWGVDPGEGITCVCQ